MTSTMQSPRVGMVEQSRLPLLVEQLNSWRNDMPPADLETYAPESTSGYAVYAGDQVVGGYLLIMIPMANEIIGLAVDPMFRRHGLGRMLCMDALFRSGKRPLVLTANDASVGFAKAVGFKMFGKRKQPDGTFLTRLGWHAPRPQDATS